VARWSTGSGSIDVWWHSRKNGALMLILAHLLSHAHAWRNRPIRLLHAVEPWEDSEEMLAAMHEMLLTARIRATPQIIVAEDPTSCISWHSRDAAVTILGMDPPEDTASMRAWYADIQARIENLGEVVLVSNAGNVRLGD
jgi:hypothetical protein